VYRARARAWYEALAAFLTPWWNDPIVSWQLDNETGLLFANRVGQIDFNVDTIQRFRAWLEGRYGTVDALAAAWGIAFGSFGEVLPPRPRWPRGRSRTGRRSSRRGSTTTCGSSPRRRASWACRCR